MKNKVLNILTAMLLIQCTNNIKYLWPIHTEKWFHGKSRILKATDGSKITITECSWDSTYSSAGYFGSNTHWFSQTLKFNILTDRTQNDTLKGIFSLKYDDVSKKCSVSISVDSFELTIDDYIAYSGKFKPKKDSVLLFKGWTSIKPGIGYGFVDTFMLCSENDILALRLNNKIYRSY